MKKFFAILCAVAMVASFTTSAFADSPTDPSDVAAINDPMNVYDGTYGQGGGAGAGAATTIGGGAGQAAAPAATSAAPAATTDASTAAAPAAQAAAPAAAQTASVVVANPADYEGEGIADSLAKILVSMLNSPVEENSPAYTSADVMKAMAINYPEKKTVKGTAIDTTKLTVISKALDSKSTGCKFTAKTDSKEIDVELQGNELTKGREAGELFIIVAPKDPAEKEAYVADVEINDNVLTFTIPMDAAICICLLQK